jgi:hypothetical protein
MTFFDGNPPEMPEHRPVDDGAIEAALAGSTRGPDLDALSSFVSGVRSVVEAVPTPSAPMAAVLAAGLSTVNGDLSATAASNVNGPASQEAGLPKWRKAYMKIQGFIAGLGVAGKVALGVGVAAAATTGAGAAGVLPFSAPGHSHRHPVSVLTNTTTTTPNAKAPIRAASARRITHPGKHAVTPRPPGAASSGVTTTTVTVPTTAPSPPVTTTTVTTPAAGTTPTTDTTPTTETPTTLYAPTPTTTAPPTSTTPTTQPPSGQAPTQSIQLSCSVTGPTQVTCTWTGAPQPVAKYSLWRWTTGGNGSDYGSIFDTPDGLTFVVDNVGPGVPYTYRVFTTLGDGTSGPWSNRVYMSAL